MKKNARLLVIVVVLLLASLACQAVTIPTNPIQTPVGISQPAVSPVLISATGLLEQQDALTSLYENVMPGVVSVEAFTDTTGAGGTGFVYDTNGYIITNMHVVEGAKEIEVDFSSGLKVFGKLVGTDPDSDLAVIKVDAPAEELHPLTLGDSSKLKVGQIVVAIGNPFQLTGSMSSGIISALGRTLPSAHQAPGGSVFSAADQIQTDAAINHGNSGGPLFNLNGEVIGINRYILTDTTNANGDTLNSGVGFAIAINIVKRVVPEIIKNGKYDYPYLGIGSPKNDLTLDEINALGLKQPTGAYVTNVTPGSPAEKAGIVAGTKDIGSPAGIMAGGDLIIAIEGQPIRSFDQLISILINTKSPGDTVTLTVLRGSEKVDVQLTLDKRP